MVMRFTVVFCFSILISFCFGQSTIQWHKAKVNLEHQSIEKLIHSGVDCDHGHHRAGKSFTGVFTDQDLARLQKAGLEYELMPKAKIETRSNPFNCDEDRIGEPYYRLPGNYPYGSMGGFPTLNELMENLDLMHELYPHLVTSKIKIGNFKTAQGRPIYYLKISDRPDQEEEDEPKVLYTALHHAREPISMSQMLYFMWSLLENYELDPEVKRLVDSRELFFVPCLNPDGYSYNETMAPGGGGDWRKNMNPNTEGVGTDLNRNYAEGWAFDDSGSSPSGGSITYRGQNAFSEAETQAIRSLCLDFDFRIVLNYHAYGNLLIIPWGYLNRPTADSVQFLALAKEFTKYNQFFVGTSQATLNYSVNGVSDDWMYGKRQIYAFTPEVGDEFWPDRKEILPLNQSTQYMNYSAAWNAGACATINEVSSKGIEKDTFMLQLSIQRNGIQDDLINITPGCNIPGVEFSEPEYQFSLAKGENRVVEIPVYINAPLSKGDSLDFVFNLRTGDFVQNLIFRKFYFGQAVWKEECLDLSRWYSVTQEQWKLSSKTFYSAPSSFTDSPEGNLKEGQTLKMQTLGYVNLEKAEKAFLSFQTKYDLDSEADYVQVKGSTDGSQFIPFCGLFTQQGTHFLDPNFPLYTGTKSDWAAEWINLKDFLGQKLFLELFFNTTYSGIPHDGFYIDDIKVYVKNKVNTATSDSGLLQSYYPNPVTEEMHFVPANLSSDCKLTVYNLQGQIMDCKTNRHNQELVLSTSSLLPGMYIVKIQDGSKPLTTLSFVKQ